MTRSLEKGKHLTDRNRHRGGLTSRLGAIWPDASLFARIGGAPVVSRIIEGLYDRIEADVRLRTLFFRDPATERANQKRFFTEFFGGDEGYDHYGSLRSRHAGLRVSKRAASTWLRFFKAAMLDAGIRDEAAQEILRTLAPIAKAFVNEAGQPEDEAIELKGGAVRSHMHHPCVHRWRDAAKVVAKGDLQAVRALLDDDPEILSPAQGGHPERLLFEAARRGHRAIAQLLVERGADVNAPTTVHTGNASIALTPWCIARDRRKTAVADYLRAAGAVLDLFSAAYLGDAELATTILEADPELIHAHDPCIDFAGVLPIHHALHAGHHAMVAFLLERGSGLGRATHEFVRAAADHQDGAMLDLLLASGADATRIGPGEWVRHAALADRLLAAGADVNVPPADWLEFCTAHHGQKDDPSLVRALLDHGADLDARSPKGRTSVHLAAKAGHLETLAVLLESGADPNATDPEGATPLHMVFQAGKSADRIATTDCLLAAGADPAIADSTGRSARDLATRGRRAESQALLRRMQGKGAK